MLNLDYRDRQCPYPVVETRKQMLAHPDRQLLVLVSDEICRDNLSRLADTMGYRMTATIVDRGFELILTKTSSTTATESNAAMKKHAATGATAIYCGSDGMGSGDDDLRRLLIKNFFITQLELDPLPAAILFVNSGIRLTTEGSDVIEPLSALSRAGVDIASCGLCLDFYQKKDKLAVGRVTNMLDIVEIQNGAGRVICP